jgi:formylglycine-generating enzyme required for sulfatase activity
MKKIHPIFLITVTLSIAVAACGSALETPPAQDQEPAAPPSQPAHLEPETPTIQPIDLAGPQAGTPMVWVDGSILVHVPGGEFVMGDGGEDNPVHTVGLSSFWIYRTKVTNRMYSICIAAGQCAAPQDDEAVRALSDPRRQDFPVVNVDWEQAAAYCRFVAGRLPSEAQWEKTARGPDGNIYPWGDAAPTCDLSNIKDCIGDKSDVFDHPAGKSYYEALDLAGNVFEWVADWYTPVYYSESPGVDPLGPDIGEVRSVRSTGFTSEPEVVSSARRFYLKPEEHRLDLGFRCVVEDPAEYEPFCEEVFIPGYPDNSQASRPPSSQDCPVPEFTTFVGECIDQEGQIGSGSVRIEGGELVSVTGSDCSEGTPGTWFCTGPQGTGVSITACLACEAEEGSVPSGADCPPGTYDDGQGNCVGRGDMGECPNGYTFDPSNECCSAEPDIPYPGCDPIGEYLTALHTCQPGPAPLGDSCGVVSVPMGSCRQPDDDGDRCTPTGIYCYFDSDCPRGSGNICSANQTCVCP